MKNLFKKPWLLPVIIFVLATLVRLYVLFYVTDPQNPGVGWYTDTYHHWQIAYLTKEIGLAKGRLWDLKGMEYFWGIGHPLILACLFFLTGSVDILVPRLLTVFSGSLFVVFLYLIVKRYWGQEVGLATALFATFSPVAIFTDVSGLQPPIGWLFLILGFYFWPKKPFLTGFFWVLAGTIRAEFWLIGAALVFLGMFYEKSFDRRIILLISYLVFCGLHLKILLDKTHNAIYPLYWNYRGNIAGEWVGKKTGPLVLTPLMEKIRLLSWPVFIGCGLVMIYLWLRKKGRAQLFLSFGFLNIGFLAAVSSLGDYIHTYTLDYFWLSQLFSWPYDFLGLLLIIFLFRWRKVKVLNWLVVLAVLIIFSQIGWPIILNKYHDMEKDWHLDKQEAALISSFYQGGSILLPADRPDLIYALVRFGGIKGRNIRGDMFEPFYYMEGDTWKNWVENREIVVDWLKKEEIRLMAVYSNSKYGQIAKKEKKIFKFLKAGNWVEIYEVRL